LFSFGRYAQGRDAEDRSAARIAGPLGARLAVDPSLMQLLPLAALRAEAAAAGLAAHAAPRSRQAEAFLHHARVLAEAARRAGEVETLAQAASALQRARSLAAGDRVLEAEALVLHAEVLTLSAALFNDPASAEAAEAKLALAFALPLLAPALAAPTRARALALRGRLLALAALKARSPKACAAALDALKEAARALDALAAVGVVDPSAAAEVRCDRAELRLAGGEARKDRAALDAALADLSDLGLDPAVRPLTWARAETLRGQALAGLGDLAGDAGALAEAVAVLAAVAAETLIDHSPLDAARAGHALGLAQQALGEACEEDALFDRAVAAFAPALEALDAQPLLPFRCIVAHDAAACLARRAERRGDLAALERAEAAFRDALKTNSAAKDPLSWAVTQVALARIYEAEADLRGDKGERADAAFALASALEVFAERGLRSLSEAALTALERVKAAA
jgi:hypothetical protein